MQLFYTVVLIHEHDDFNIQSLQSHRVCSAIELADEKNSPLILVDHK